MRHLLVVIFASPHFELESWGKVRILLCQFAKSLPFLHHISQLVIQEEFLQVILPDDLLDLLRGFVQLFVQSEIEIAHPKHIIVEKNLGSLPHVKLLVFNNTVVVLDAILELMIVGAEVRVHEAQRTPVNTESCADRPFVSLQQSSENVRSRGDVDTHPHPR